MFFCFCHRHTTIRVDKTILVRIRTMCTYRYGKKSKRCHVAFTCNAHCTLLSAYSATVSHLHNYESSFELSSVQEAMRSTHARSRKQACEHFRKCFRLQCIHLHSSKCACKDFSSTWIEPAPIQKYHGDFQAQESSDACTRLGWSVRVRRPLHPWRTDVLSPRHRLLQPTS